jgi:hypothetical protein
VLGGGEMRWKEWILSRMLNNADMGLVFLLWLLIHIVFEPRKNDSSVHNSMPLIG